MRSAVLDDSVTIVVSDLHLGATAGAADATFALFLEWLGARAAGDRRAWRIVILGDFLDLLHAPGATPVAALEAAVRGRAVLRALAAASASEISIEIVPGNHDSELLDRRVQERLRQLAAEAAGPGTPRAPVNLTFHAWFLLLPGVLYAEHGSQYHALNAVRDPLSPAGRWSPQIPLGALLDLGRSEPRQVLGHLARKAAASSRSRGRRRPAPSRSRMLERARETGLRPETLDGLLRLGRRSPLDLAGRALTTIGGRPRSVEAEQRAAAASVHRLLLAEAKSVPVYVFGHTHRAASADLDAGGTRLGWFNSGAWPAEHSFLEIAVSRSGVAARLRRWAGNDAVQVPTATSAAARRVYEAAE
jgi:UDP-2,3-diacylglucosamine pyrophosphatase LpxH